MKTLLLFTSFVLLCPSLFAQTSPCDYFGLEKPDTEASDFNPEILDMEGSFIFNAVFRMPDCDEFYFTKIDDKENIYWTKRVNGIWQKPHIASFSIQSFHDADPFFTSDGNRVYFVSARPTETADTDYDYNIWYADRNASGWNQPTDLPSPINTEYQEYFFSISDSGNGYFSSNRPGGIGSFDIYKVKISNDGSISDPVNIGGPINTERYEFDPFMSADESLMIFSINNDQGLSDMFFSYKSEDGVWSSAIDLGEKINTSKEDFGPSISPDNKYIFFTNGGKLKWISIDMLESLK